MQAGERHSRPESDPFAEDEEEAVEEPGGQRRRPGGEGEVGDPGHGLRGGPEPLVDAGRHRPEAGVAPGRPDLQPDHEARFAAPPTGTACVIWPGPLPSSI